MKNMPSWMAENASLSDTIECHEIKPMVIRTKDDYDTYASNTTLVESTALGRVIVTWPDITDLELAKLLEKKTHVQELVIEDCSKLTRMSPALDVLKTVDSRFVLDNLKSVKTIKLASLNTTGGGLIIVGRPIVTALEMPKLTVVGAGL